MFSDTRSVTERKTNIVKMIVYLPECLLWLRFLNHLSLKNEQEAKSNPERVAVLL